MLIGNSVNYNKKSSRESEIRNNDLFSKINDSDIEEILREKEEEQEQYIQEQYKKNIIIDYKNIQSNDKSNKKQEQKQSLKSNPIITSEHEKERSIILNHIQKLKKENTDLSFEQWSDTLNEKRQNLNDKIGEYFHEISLELDFVLSIKTILNIEDITLPFMGIVLAVPSSLKTKVIELLRKWMYSYFTDKFTAKSFVSHSATVAKDKLKEVDLLPRIKDKILLTPELSPLFTGKEEDIKEQFGIITRLLDGNGLETESGVHGQRGYHGNYMFTWIGAAVDIPHYVYKFLSTIGFKIYFLRLPRSEISEDDLFNQITAEKPFNEKMMEIEKLLLDYLNWFEICPFSIGIQNIVKIEWDKSKDDKNAIRIIARLAILLARLRGDVYVRKSSDRDDLVIPTNNNTNNNNTNTNPPAATIVNFSEGFIHAIPIIENPSRANQQLYNLARGHALSHGRNYITMEDISLVLKVVLSTGSIERVLILDLLIAHKGTLITSQITAAMRISNNSAKRTMTEFKGLELVTMNRVGDNSNSEYKIILNPKFNWFLTDEFKNLRDDFKTTDNKEYTKTKHKKDNFANEKGDQQVCCNQNTPCVHTPNEEIELSNSVLAIGNNYQSRKNGEGEAKDNNVDYSHKGKNGDSKNNTAEIDNNIQSTFPITNSLSPAFEVSPTLQQHSKILFNNPLIVESDLSIGGYNYDPEIINNIDRFDGSDQWFCNNCSIKGDKWFMMKHICYNTKRRKNKKLATDKLTN
jgi:hypothetical protein